MQRNRSWNRALFGISFLLMAVMSAFVQVIPLSSPPEHFIGHSDQADLAMVARNIAEGKGAVVDCIWIINNGGLPGTEVTHPESYWSIYVAAFLAPFFKILGSTRQTTVLTGCLVKTGIAALACYWTLRDRQGDLARRRYCYDAKPVGVLIPYEIKECNSAG